MGIAVIEVLELVRKMGGTVDVVTSTTGCDFLEELCEVSESGVLKLEHLRSEEVLRK